MASQNTGTRKGNNAKIYTQQDLDQAVAKSKVQESGSMNKTEAKVEKQRGELEINIAEVELIASGFSKDVDRLGRIISKVSSNDQIQKTVSQPDSGSGTTQAGPLTLLQRVDAAIKQLRYAGEKFYNCLEVLEKTL